MLQHGNVSPIWHLLEDRKLKTFLFASDYAHLAVFRLCYPAGRDASLAKVGLLGCGERATSSANDRFLEVKTALGHALEHLIHASNPTIKNTGHVSGSEDRSWSQKSQTSLKQHTHFVEGPYVAATIDRRGDRNPYFYLPLN